MQTPHTYTPEPRFADTLEFTPFDLFSILTTEEQDAREGESLEAFLDRMRMEGRA